MSKEPKLKLLSEEEIEKNRIKAYKYIDMSKEEAKDQLIEVLMNQVVDLTMMSKIELGDDVITEIKRLKEIINQNKDE